MSISHFHVLIIFLVNRPIPSTKFPLFQLILLLEVAEAYLKKVSSVKKSENFSFGGLKFGK